MTKPARSESAFPLWRKGIPRLARALSKAKAMGKLIPDDDIAGQAGLIELDLRINREIRETLLAEMRVRREVVELRKLELDGMCQDEIEQLLVRTAARRGYRHIDGIRSGLVDFLTERGATPDQAKRLVDAAVPPVRIERPGKRLDRSLGQTYDALQADLEEGARECREALEDSSVSETQADAQPVGATTANGPGGTDEGGGP